MNNKERYNRVVSRLPIFYQPWWLDAVCKQGWDVALSFEAQELVAVWPYSMEKKWGFQLIRNPLLTPYLGPLFFHPKDLGDDMQRWDWEDEQASTLLQQLPRHHYLQFTTVPEFHNFLSFHRKGLTNKNRLTYYINLSDSEERILGNMQKRRRRYIKNAGDELQVVDAAPFMQAFLGIHQETFDLKKAPYPYTSQFLIQLIATVDKHKSGKFWAIVNKHNEPAAMLWVVYDGQKMYQLLSCFPKNKEYPQAMTLLTWHAIKEAKKLNLEVYDFEGSVDYGIELFFRKFGGRRHPYLYFEKHNSLIWSIKQKFLG